MFLRALFCTQTARNRDGRTITYFVLYTARRQTTAADDGTIIPGSLSGREQLQYPCIILWPLTNEKVCGTLSSSLRYYDDATTAVTRRASGTRARAKSQGRKRRLRYKHTAAKGDTGLVFSNFRIFDVPPRPFCSMLRDGDSGSIFGLDHSRPSRAPSGLEHFLARACFVVVFGVQLKNRIVKPLETWIVWISVPSTKNRKSIVSCNESIIPAGALNNK